ncbi:hypothetical protein HN371_00160, partial [Candidatus Poribacteria bacterium]|nr:hypothetical protein [Candidatus Poribacteria bacterium]
NYTKTTAQAALMARFGSVEMHSGPETIRRRDNVRPSFRDTWSIEHALRHGDVFEVKEDGRWAFVTVRAGEAVLVSRTGSEMARFAVDSDADAVLCAEYLVGQPACRKGSPRHGQVVAFDCVEFDGASLQDRPLSERRYAAASVVAGLDARFELVEQLPTAGLDVASLAGALQAADDEGIVVKDTASTFGAVWTRFKRRA